MTVLKRGKVAVKKLEAYSIEDLVGDWFDRDSETFIKISAEHKIDWTEGTASSFVLRGRHSGWDLLSESYKLVRSLLLAMDLPNRFNLRFHRTESRTDGFNIFIATEVLDEKELSVEERVDILLGIAAHEGSHIKFTDMNYMQTWEKTLPRPEAHLIFDIFNILEDERIEQELGNDSPGLVRYIAPLKKYMCETLYERSIAELVEKIKTVEEAEYRAAVRKALDDGTKIPVEPDYGKKSTKEYMNPYERISSLFYNIIRYPKNIDREEIKYFGKYILDLKAAVTPYPTDTVECCECAEKIWAIFKEFYVAPPKKDSVTEDEEGRLIILLPPGSGGEEGEPLTITDKDTVIDLTDSEHPIDSDMLKDASKISEIMRSSMRRSIEEGTDHGAEAGEVRMFSTELSILEGDAFEGTTKGTLFVRAPNNESAYIRSRNRISPYVAPLRKSLQLHNQHFTRTLRGQRNGELDASRIVEAGMGVPTVHLRYQKVNTDNVAIGVLIDQSASMSGENMDAARDGAILLHEALASISNIELFVYGHTADTKGRGSTDLFIYSEPNYRPRFALGSAKAISQNRDGVAIIETARRMRKFTNNNGVLFVLSDGAPCASMYSGDEANKDTYKRVQEAQRLGFTVVQIAIESHVPSEEMFDKFVKFTDLSQLARQMGMLVKQLALAKAKIRIEG